MPCIQENLWLRELLTLVAQDLERLAAQQHPPLCRLLRGQPLQVLSHEREQLA